MRERRSAYTLFELLMVLMVLGILAGVAAPRYASAITQQRLEAAVLRVEADLRMARAHAVRTSQRQVVNFFPDSDRYAIITMVDLDHSNQRYEVSFSRTGYAVDLVSADFNGSQSVTFDIYGRPDAAGTVTLQHAGVDRQVQLAASGEVTQP